MQYEKPIMTKRALKNMGFSEAFLDEAYRIGRCAFKSTSRKNSPLLYDTEALEKFRKARCVW